MTTLSGNIFSLGDAIMFEDAMLKEVFEEMLMERIRELLKMDNYEKSAKNG